MVKAVLDSGRGYPIYTNKPIQIIAIYEDGGFLDVTEAMYWFEEHGIRDINNDDCFGHKFSYEIYAYGKMVYPDEENPPGRRSLCLCGDGIESMNHFDDAVTQYHNILKE